MITLVELSPPLAGSRSVIGKEVVIVVSFQIFPRRDGENVQASDRD